MHQRKRERLGFVRTATISGVEALSVTVEVNVGQGLPGISIVGMPGISRFRRLVSECVSRFALPVSRS